MAPDPDLDSQAVSRARAPLPRLYRGLNSARVEVGAIVQSRCRYQGNAFALPGKKPEHGHIVYLSQDDRQDPCQVEHAVERVTAQPG